ncbi:MAG: hypothetical protein LBR25_03225 [Erysipelotrichaceae bacterium]|jgi:hypothetical protein|nr:hypothetical protein [Erysipelotrichaceae bacterium]
MSWTNLHLKSPEVEADIHYFPAWQTGRLKPVYSGEEVCISYDEKEFEAVQEFIDKETCLLGETVKAYLRMEEPLDHIKKLYVGKEFNILEDLAVIGRGIITRIIRYDFDNGGGNTLKAFLSKENFSLELAKRVLNNMSTQDEDVMCFNLNELQFDFVECKVVLIYYVIDKNYPVVSMKFDELTRLLERYLQQQKNHT